jgi:hypothetical protein
LTKHLPKGQRKGERAALQGWRWVKRRGMSEEREFEGFGGYLMEQDNGMITVGFRITLTMFKAYE